MKPRNFAGLLTVCMLALGIGLGGCSSTSSTSSSTSSTDSSGTDPSAVDESTSDATSSPSDPGALLLYQWARTGGGGDAIWVANEDGSGTHSVQPAEVASGYHPDWSPDGSQIVFADQDKGLWTMSAKGASPQLIQECEGCDFPAWSPDGKRIAYTQYTNATDSQPPASSTLVVLDLATKELTEVTSAKQPKLVDVPRWSPDGARLVYGIDLFDGDFAEAGSAIAVVSVKGGKPKLLTDFDQYAYYPDWNRVTNEIVFSTETMGYAATPPRASDTWDLFTISPDGTGLRALTDVQEGRLWQPSWTPDGTRITATQDLAGSRSAVWVGTDGAVSARLTSATHTRLQPTP